MKQKKYFGLEHIIHQKFNTHTIPRGSEGGSHPRKEDFRHIEMTDQSNVPEGYELKLCKNGQYRLYKILTDEEKKAKVQKMIEGRKRKKEEKEREKQ